MKSKKYINRGLFCLRMASFLAGASLQSVCAQSLGEFLEMAEENNPKVQAYKLRYDIAGEKVSEATTLPDTEFGAGIFVSEPETRTGAQKARFSVRQMLPWFGTITARENYAESLADAEYVELSLTRRQLALDVARAYYSLYSNQARQGVLDENRVLLKSYEEQALTAVEVGKATVVSVLRIQIRENELREKSETLQQEFEALRASLNALLNRESRVAVTIEDSLKIPEKDAGPEELSVSLHPELLKFDKLYESVQQAEALNQKESAPRLGVGVDYIPVQERAGMTMNDNGKDIVMPMVSLSVPVFNSTYGSRTRQNSLRQKELAAMKAERANALKSMLQQAIAARNAARIHYAAQVLNLGHARSAEDLLLRNYETGTLDFDELLEIQELQLKFEIQQIEAVEAYYNQAAKVNYLVSS